MICLNKHFWDEITFDGNLSTFKKIGRLCVQNMTV